MMAGTFKKRYTNHKKSLNIPRYSAEIDLLNMAMHMAGAAKCNLCLEEKVCLLEADKSRILNKRSELFAKCCHRNSFSVRKFERMQGASANR